MKRESRLKMNQEVLPPSFLIADGTKVDVISPRQDFTCTTNEMLQQNKGTSEAEESARHRLGSFFFFFFFWNA